jgi:probable rRNA maturation factor
MQRFYADYSYELGIHLVTSTEIEKLNRQFLKHAGSTDVITFDYMSDNLDQPEGSRVLYGEIFISLEDAQKQAQEFNSSPQSEIIRYLIHGILHLTGYDDQTASQYRLMKTEEDRILAALSSQFELNRLIGKYGAEH